MGHWQQGPHATGPLERAPAKPQHGHRVGPFILQEEVGHGGFGAVYRAHHQELPGDFAVKLIHWHHANQPQLLQRFQREAHTLTQLQHPNVVQLVDFGQIEEIGLYIAMEFLHGRSLAQLIAADFPLPMQRLRSIIWQLCDVLHFAHSRGIVHRDLKPSNIIVCQRPEGEVVKLIDFGIAAVAEHTHLTQTGTFLGSPAYMSPEQIKGEKQELGPESDIYSLGILFTQLLTQRRPFEANNVTGFVTHHLFTSPPSLSALRPELHWHPAIEACIARSLAKEPHERYQDAHALGRALLAGLEGQGELRLQPLARDESLPEGSTPSPPGETSSFRHYLHTQTTPLPTRSLLEETQASPHAAPMVPLEATAALSPRLPTALEAASHTDKPDAPQRDEPRPSGPRTWLLVGGVVAFVAIIGVAIAMFARSSPQSPAAPSNGKISSTQLLIESQPPGAGVFVGTRQICQTPCSLRGAPGEQRAALIQKAGYYPQPLRWTFRRTRAIHNIQLRPLPAQPSTRRPAPRQPTSPPRAARASASRRRARRAKRRRRRRQRQQKPLARRRVKRRTPPKRREPFGVDPLKGLLTP